MKKDNENKIIMILGASILQLPAILKAKEMGLKVIAVDKDANAIGFKVADICLEISTINIPKVIDAAKAYGIDSIMTLASDMPIRTVAAVSKELNIIGINEETAKKVTNKTLMRECLQKNNVPIPNFYKANYFNEFLSAIQKINGKVIVKPADNSGSRGVYLINDYNNIDSVKYAYEYSKKYSRSGEIIVEEFIEGPEVSVETLSVEGVVHVIAITDKLTTGAPQFVEMGHSQPSMLSNAIKKQIEIIVDDAVKSLGILNGPAHTEIIITDNGPKIVEVGARLGGDNITTQLVPLSTGIDMVKACIEISLGVKPNLERKLSIGSAIRYLKTVEGKITNVKGINQAELMKGVKQIYLMKNIGDDVVEIMSSTDRVGFVISQAEDAKSAIAICEKASELIEVCVQDGEVKK